MSDTENNVDDCPRCGYRPRRKDRQVQLMNEGVADYEYSIVHVRCYNCGEEWVE